MMVGAEKHKSKEEKEIRRKGMKNRRKDFRGQSRERGGWRGKGCKVYLQHNVKKEGKKWRWRNITDREENDEGRKKQRKWRRQTD